MGRRRRRKAPPRGEFEAKIESLSHDGRGVTHIDGKTVFLDGALPDERVLFEYTATSRKHDEGRVNQVLEASPDRVEPRCASFRLCGGCSLQHLDPDRQLAFKQQSMLEGLERIGKVTPEQVLEPLRAGIWGYRRKARLGVRHVRKKDRVLVGFREKRNSFITDVSDCPVLDERVGARLTEIGAMIHSLDARATLPQIEVAITDDRVALVFRHLEPLSGDDRAKLIRFGEQYGFDLYLQPGGPHTVQPLTEGCEALRYRHPDFDVAIEFSPLDFTQVNDGVNRLMVAQAAALLDPRPDDRVLDLFCGLGNFTLPLARRAAEVAGVEGDAAMLERARRNAEANGLHNTRYFVADLMSDELGQEPWLRQPWNRILLDPPRSGAAEAIRHVGQLGARRIVYVSCHPGTLARDAGELVHAHGYRLTHAGVMDMFPHTAHVESMAVFEKA
ncbi:MAG TPA: 23S rRNA (uracil(1939)-C(5))-methyltransferase RlmD [Gammaproteobacteria bacterium]|nr:23S rRNA (uracil(1939)-C(5))-methyltransferase RlmD [Gammaproteobacteria bacterium]